MALCTCIFLPYTVSAAAVYDVDFKVDSVYVDAEIDFFGSLHVREAIVVKGSLNGFERDVYFRNSRLADWTTGQIDFASSSIYNARSTSLSSAKSFKIEKDEIGWELLDTDSANFELAEYASTGSTGVYTVSDMADGIGVRIYNPNESGYVVYFYDYYLDQAVVLHDDVAELYWTFIPEDFEHIDHAHIQVKVPGYSKQDVFRFWAHGSLNGNVSGISDKKDEDDNDLYRGVYAEVDDVRTGTGVDIRMTFDKSIVSFGEDFLDYSGMEALNKIIEVEEERANEANRARTIARALYWALIVLGSAYLIGLVILWIYMYIKFDREYRIDFVSDYYREFTGDYGVEVVDYLMNKDVSTNAMSASIMNLIYKKNIEVIDNPNDAKNPTLQLKSRENLTPAEEKLMNLLFDTVTKNGSFTLKELEKFSSKYSTAESFMKGYRAWKDIVVENGIAENFFEDHTIHKLAAAAYMILGLILVVIMILFELIIPFFIVAIPLSSICFLIYILTFKKWTKKGREHYLKWTAFKNFLRDFGSFKDKELPEIALWEKYLVYATVFGLAEKVQKSMKVKLSEMDNVDSGTYINNNWMFYHNYYIGNSISRSINRTYSNSQNTISAAHSSSSSGSGFGGGFSSGGGFGGGGGGGHGF